MSVVFNLPCQDHTLNSSIKNTINPGSSATGTKYSYLMTQTGAGGSYRNSLLINNLNFINFSSVSIANGSVSLWIKFSQNFGTFDITSKFTATKRFIRFDLTGLICSVFDNASNSMDMVMPSIDYTSWHHIVITQVDITTCLLYIDGILSSFSTAVGDGSSISFTSLGGNITGAYNFNVNGFKIYNSIITTGEILSDYLLGRTTGTVNTQIYNTKFFDSNVKKSDTTIIVGAGGQFRNVANTIPPNININTIRYSGDFHYNIPPNTGV